MSAESTHPVPSVAVVEHELLAHDASIKDAVRDCTIEQKMVELKSQLRHLFKAHSAACGVGGKVQEEMTALFERPLFLFRVTLLWKENGDQLPLKIRQQLRKELAEADAKQEPEPVVQTAPRLLLSKARQKKTNDAAVCHPGQDATRASPPHVASAPVVRSAQFEQTTVVRNDRPKSNANSVFSLNLVGKPRLENPNPSGMTTTSAPAPPRRKRFKLKSEPQPGAPRKLKCDRCIQDSAQCLELVGGRGACFRCNKTKQACEYGGVGVSITGPPTDDNGAWEQGDGAQEREQDSGDNMQVDDSGSARAAANRARTEVNIGARLANGLDRLIPTASEALVPRAKTSEKEKEPATTGPAISDLNAKMADLHERLVTFEKGTTPSSSKALTLEDLAQRIAGLETRWQSFLQSEKEWSKRYQAIEYELGEYKVEKIKKAEEEAKKLKVRDQWFDIIYHLLCEVRSKVGLNSDTVGKLDTVLLDMVGDKEQPTKANIAPLVIDSTQVRQSALGSPLAADVDKGDQKPEAAPSSSPPLITTVQAIAPPPTLPSQPPSLGYSGASLPAEGGTSSVPKEKIIKTPTPPPAPLHAVLTYPAASHKAPSLGRSGSPNAGDLASRAPTDILHPPPTAVAEVEPNMVASSLPPRSPPPTGPQPDFALTVVPPTPAIVPTTALTRQEGLTENLEESPNLNDEDMDAGDRPRVTEMPSEIPCSTSPPSVHPAVENGLPTWACAILPGGDLSPPSPIAPESYFPNTTIQPVPERRVRHASVPRRVIPEAARRRSHRIAGATPTNPTTTAAAVGSNVSEGKRKKERSAEVEVEEEARPMKRLRGHSRDPSRSGQ